MTEQEREQIEWAYLDRQNTLRRQADEEERRRIEKKREAKRQQVVESERERREREEAARKRRSNTPTQQAGGSQKSTWGSPGLAFLFAIIGVIACVAGEMGEPAAGLILGAVCGYFARFILAVAAVGFLIWVVSTMSQ